MKAKLSVLPAVVALAICIPVNAHHSFAAVFDVNSTVAVTGEVTMVEWMNPHAWIYIDVEENNGGSENWAF